MNKSTAITVELQGPRGPAELSDFANVVNALRSSLRHVTRCLAGTDEIEYEVSDLHFGSAVLETQPVQNQIPYEVLLDVSRTLTDTITSLEGGGEPDGRLDYLALRALNQFSSVVRRPGNSLAVGRTKLTQRFVDRINVILEPDMESMGSVTGRLEEFSIHNGSKFKLYPPVSGEEVECVFDRSDLEAVLKAVDRTVTVYGLLRYSRPKAFPVSVRVSKFEVHPPESELPTLLTACGSMCSSDTSENMIRELRNEWQ